MAYENYNFVSWSDGSPLSSNRLGQMSTNIEQVKDVVDDKAQGVLRLNQIQSLYPNSTGYSGFGENEIIYLKDQSLEEGGSDRRVTVEANRYYKVVFNIPAITILNRGSEDSKYTINLWSGTGISDLNKSKIGSWDITPSIYGYIDVSTNSSGNTFTVSGNTYPAFTVKTTFYPTKIGAGTYSVVQTSGSEKELDKTFFVSITRSQGLSTNNAPNWRIDATSSSPIQFYVEDVGGI